MGTIRSYVEREMKAVGTENRFEHVMALTLDPMSRYREGIVRCVTSRQGDVEISGFVDRSELRLVLGTGDGGFAIGGRLAIRNEEEIVGKMGREYGLAFEFLGLEDPDIFRDEVGRLHIYFTIPFADLRTDSFFISLGHAEGDSFDDLLMTEPVLRHGETDDIRGVAKEVSIAPKNGYGVRNNLFESAERVDGEWCSVIRLASAREMSGPWERGKILFHPYERGVEWAMEHASPGPLLPRSFIDVGKNRLLGIMNARGRSEFVGGVKKYGRFSIGLFVYDFESGNIDWVSPEPLIFDSQARSITFASDFVETGPGRGTLYAHVDDSFVRAYDLDSEGIRELLP